MDTAISTRGKWVLRAFFAFFVLFLYAPLLLLVMFSFNDADVPSFPLSGFTTDAYEQFASNDQLKASVVTSVKVSAIASLANIITKGSTNFH